LTSGREEETLNMNIITFFPSPRLAKAAVNQGKERMDVGFAQRMTRLGVRL
jgi:hypothetical protein